jgi:hypothetical protein
MVAGVFLGAVVLQTRYTLTLQSPIRIRFQWPLVIAPRATDDEASAAQADQSGRRLTAYQQYACNKFGTACRVALAVQRAENPHGACEIYHYNSDGTLDWGYFQINTVHLKRDGVNLRGRWIAKPTSTSLISYTPRAALNRGRRLKAVHTGNS